GRPGLSVLHGRTRRRRGSARLGGAGFGLRRGILRRLAGFGRGGFSGGVRIRRRSAVGGNAVRRGLHGRRLRHRVGVRGDRRGRRGGRDRCRGRDQVVGGRVQAFHVAGQRTDLFLGQAAGDVRHDLEQVV